MKDIKTILSDLGVTDITNIYAVKHAWSKLNELNDNAIVFHGEGLYYQDLEVIEEHIKTLCNHDFEPVAFNTEIEDNDGNIIHLLYDGICKKCGKHGIIDCDEDGNIKL